VRTIVEAERAKHVEEVADEPTIPVITMHGDDETWSVTKEGDEFVVRGQKIERFAGRTHFDNEEGVQRLRDIMRKMGILHELVRQRIKAGDTIRIGDAGRLIY
jgi:GTP-binding protein